MQLPFDRTIRRRIHLMRHGEVSYFLPDGQRVPDSRTVTLTENGRAEAGGMHDLMTTIALDRAICSGLPRTVETANIVLGERKLPLEKVPELEEIRGGDATARARLSPPDYAYAMYKAVEPGACYANGENFGAFYARVTGAFSKIIEEMTWTNLLLVAHGGVNRGILAYATGAGLNGFAVFEQDTACLNVIDVDTDIDSGAVVRFALRAINVSADDPTKATRRLLTMEKLALKAFPQMRAKN
jgi:probable phosphoglycerate mutase